MAARLSSSSSSSSRPSSSSLSRQLRRQRHGLYGPSHVRAVSDVEGGETRPSTRNTRRAERRRLRWGERARRDAAALEQRRVLELEEKRVEMVERIMRDKVMNTGAQGFGATGALLKAQQRRAAEFADAEERGVSLADTESLLAEQEERARSVKHVCEMPNSRVPLSPRRILQLDRPLVFLGGLPRRFDVERWLREYITSREKRTRGSGGAGAEHGHAGETILRIDPIVMSPADYKHSARPSGGRSPPCRGFAIITLANDAAAKDFISRYDQLRDTVAGRECVLSARRARMSELGRLKRHPTMKGLIMSPFVPDEAAAAEARGDRTTTEGAAASGHADGDVRALSDALDFTRLVPNPEDMLDSIGGIAEGSLKLGRWKPAAAPRRRLRTPRTESERRR